MRKIGLLITPLAALIGAILMATSTPSHAFAPEAPAVQAGQTI